MADGNCIGRLPGQNLHRQVMSCGPLVTRRGLNDLMAEVMNVEKVANPWRTTALLAAKGGEYYRYLASNPSAAYEHVGVLAELEDFANRLEAMRNIADAVRLRIMVASTGHDDFAAWCAEGCLQ